MKLSVRRQNADVHLVKLQDISSTLDNSDKIGIQAEVNSDAQLLVHRGSFRSQMHVRGSVSELRVAFQSYY